MDIKNLPIVKQDDRGTIYDCDKITYVVRKKGTTGADHTHEDKEILFLLEGEIEMTIGDETKVVKAPAKINIPPNIYHKLLTLTSIKLLDLREK